jgi:hypothetical protein
VEKVFLRKRDLCRRYGGLHPRSIERAAEAGRIPPPEFPLGTATPLWDLKKLEANERAAVLAGRDAAAWRIRLFYELAAAADRDEAAAVLQQHNEQISTLPPRERESLLATAQDLIAEKIEEARM